MVPDELLSSFDGGVLTVTINRPEKHNPLSSGVLGSLRSALLQHAENADLKCAVIRGAGDSYFAAGGDLRSLGEVRSAHDTLAMVEHSRQALDSVRDFPVPVIALINGDALGGGAELALACDMRLMRAGARIGFIQGRLNICSAWGGGPDLFRLLGHSRALRMVSRAELIDAPTALAWGLIDDCLPDQEIGHGLAEFCAPLLRQTPTVLRAWKAQAICARRGASYAQSRACEQEHLLKTWLHDDHWAAVDRLLSARKEKI